MDDFTYDVVEKKRIAGSAIHRKGGSKSKRCTLPSDYLTEKQRRELNGPVLYYTMNQPITWNQFKSYPKDCKERYLRQISETYHANIPKFAQMFGCNHQTFRNHIIAEGLQSCILRNGHMTRREVEKWEKFINSDTIEMDTPAVVSNVCDKQSVEAPVESVPVQDFINREDGAMKMTDIRMNFTGEINIESIANTLRAVIGERKSCSVEIAIKLTE